MPNRIIKESICTSESLDGLTSFEETLFYRLVVKCDDYGRYYADPRILKGNLFPLKTLTNKQLEVAVSSLASAGIAEVYRVDGRAYLHLLAWDKHQTVRAKSSKFPPPCEDLQASANICTQVQADVPVFGNVFVNENENENAAPACESKTTYGEFGKVKLSPDEHAKLQERLGDLGTQAYIVRLDGWLAEGHSKKNHYATLLNWWRGDGEPVQRSAVQGTAKPDTGREITADMTTEELF